jgi:competence ComEA-like helix-hairpin-helix protein
MDQLLNHVNRNHPHYNEILVYQQRLTENIGQSRQYGDNDTRRTDRSEIIYHLNELSLSVLQVPFNDLCEPSTSTTEQELIKYLDSANAEALERLPGIGTVLSRRIIEYRDHNGPFTTLDDLTNVTGIGSTKIDNLKDKIKVSTPASQHPNQENTQSDRDRHSDSEEEN